MKEALKKIVVCILIIEAKLVLWRYRPHIVGITGSVGKTTTKDAVAAVLSAKYDVRKSQKSFNSELGVPLTILGLDTAWGSLGGWATNLLKGLWLFLKRHDYPEWLVLEMGVDHPGDMERLARWVKLDAVVVTRVGHLPVHVEFFPSTNAVLEEKGKILDALKSNGDVFLAYDDEGVRALKEKTKCRAHTFGYSEDADIHADYFEVLFENEKPAGITFKVLFDEKVAPIRIEGVLGRQFMYPVLAAISVGMAEGLNIVEITDALDHLETSPGRMRIISGKKGTTIIDDTYNASPIAVAEAFRVLEGLSGRGRRIAVVGTMAELGAHSEEAHRTAGKEALGSVDMLLTVGEKARGMADAAREAGLSDVVSFDSAGKAAEYLESIMSEGDIILIKGSQSVRLEKAVERVMAHPEQRHELLVRQGKAWEDR